MAGRGDSPPSSASEELDFVADAHAAQLQFMASRAAADHGGHEGAGRGSVLGLGGGRRGSSRGSASQGRGRGRAQGGGAGVEGDGPPLGRGRGVPAGVQGEGAQQDAAGDPSQPFCPPRPATTNQPKKKVTEDETKVFRDLSATVRPSVVVVEDTGKDTYCIGCVIHKSNDNTFVLTGPKMVQQGLVVHFSEEPPKPAECLASGEFFSVLATGEANETCKVVTWKDPVAESDVLVFVPNSLSTLEKVKSFITKVSCGCAAGDASPNSELEGSRELFMTLCHHKETDCMMSSPVFCKTKKDIPKANGIVFSDCTSFDGKDGSAHKICLSASRVEATLKLMTGHDSWQEALTLMGAKKAKRKRSLEPAEARGEASQHWKAGAKENTGRQAPKKHL